MMILDSVLRLVPHAYAAVEQLGANAPGVGSMWNSIKSIFPHSDLGAGAPLFFMARIGRFVLALIGGTAICSIVYAGIIVTTSSGDEGKFAEAKTIITYALGGMVLAILADRIMLYICSVIIPLIAGGGSGGCPLW